MSDKREIPTLSQLNTTVDRDRNASDTLSPEYDSKGSTSGREGGNFPMYIAINEYFKRMEDELDMKPGDKIKVITDDEEYKDGWYFGRNLRTNEEGLYPVVFTQKITVEKAPTLMRAKSTKRVHSPLTNEDPLLSSTFINENDSNSELITPQPIETAASISRNANGKLDRNLSLKNTMCDIDNALQEFKEDSVGAPDRSIASSRDEARSITHETILSATDGLDVIESNSKSSTSGSTGLLSSGVEKQTSLINGIDTSKLNPVEAELWTPEEITAYFIMEGYDVQSASRFQKHKISGKILLELELVHLKELDINSFGTRFEIFKEIEKIKEAIRTNGRSWNRTSKTNNANIHNQLMPPANVDQRTSYRGHVRKTSQSLDDLPSQQNFTPAPQANRNSSTSKHRPKSLVFGSQEPNSDFTPNIQIPQVVKEITGDEHLFVSPRRAPKPPSYPSPAQPPKSPLLSNRTVSPSSTQHNSWHSSSSSYSGSKKITYIDQTSSSNSTSNSRFALSKSIQESGKALSPIPSPTDKSISDAENSIKDRSISSKNVNSVNYSGDAVDPSFNKTTAYSSDEEGQFQETMDTVERPTSSIYADGSTIASAHNGKSTHDEKEKVKLTRRSSLLSSKSKSDSQTNSSLKRSSSVSRTSSCRKSTFMLSPFRQQFTDNAARSSPNLEGEANNTTPSAKNSSSPTEKKSSKKSESKRRSVSAKEAVHEDFTEVVKDDRNKRSVSEAVKGDTLKGKSLRQMTTRPVPKKKQTSAFIEGLRNISVKESMRDADFSGWMSKKGSGTMSTWKTRFFTLHGTRLSYFSSTTDTRERGLIDITAHRVVPAKEDDKLVSLYAASTGKGRYCFKLLPPQPGSKKGLTFTQPRTHYFAVENKEEMRGWMAALIKTTIDIDTTVPVISSYTTPTVSLSKAQEMLAEAREETKLREQEMLENEEDEDQLLWDQQQQQQQNNSQNQVGRAISVSTQRTSDEDSSVSTPNLSSATNTTIRSNGFSSPFLLASGMLSPGLARNNSMRGPEKKGKPTTEEDYFGEGSKPKNDKV